MDYQTEYFASVEDPTELASHILAKASDWFNYLTQNNYLDKIKKSWASYHGAYYYDGHRIVFGGEQGETTNIPINHYRNLARHMLTMTTSTRPSYRCRAVNTDYKSTVQARLADGILDYYLKEYNLEQALKTAVEYAIVLSAGFIKLEWDHTKGEVYDYIEPRVKTEIDPKTGEEIPVLDEDGNEVYEDGINEEIPIFQGDISFTNLSPFDIVFDSTKERYEDNEWVLCRTFKNKFALAAKYPEIADEIIGLKTKDELDGVRLSTMAFNETVDIPVYEFYHLKNEALPEGRYVKFLSEDIVLEDRELQYRRLPIYRISAGNVLGTPYGYTGMFDIIPIQDAINSLYSTVLTNQTAHGVQNILNPIGNNVRVHQVQSGMNFIEYQPIPGVAGGGKPEALNLTNTPGEIFNFITMLERTMETISGINSVVRGNPEKSLDSGAALALVQSQALQFISDLQGNYIRMLENVGTGLIELLQDYANSPRIAAIAGINNKTELKEFQGDDLGNVKRVIVDVGNALANTTAGKVQMAEQLLQMNLIKTPEDYFSVITTGNLNHMVNGQADENQLIQNENEALIEGEITIIATAVDEHNLHIRKHRQVLSDPQLRLDKNLVARVLAHIQEHINLLRTTDPDLLAICQEQPLGPQQGSSVNPQNVAPENIQQPEGNIPLEMPPQGLPNGNMPAMPSPAQPPQGLPSTPEEAMQAQMQG